MTSALTVSICLPTCNRPDLIVQCLDSCLAQRYAQLEVVIGDDSRDDRTELLIHTRYAGDARIRYTRNEMPLGQARNVASLFERASGDVIMLIHDDDFLAEDAVSRLIALWEAYPHLQVAFGNQYEVDADGQVNLQQSAILNEAFYRTRAMQGLQMQPGRTGIVQMFPNNGWMALASLVKQVGYREDVGACCDYVFGVQLCLAATHIYYLNEYVSYYRKTAASVSLSTRNSTSAASLHAYEFLMKLSLDTALESARRTALRRLAPIVVSLHARHDAPLAALRVALDHPDAYAYGFSLRLYYHLSLIARAMIAVRIRQRPSAPRFP